MQNNELLEMINQLDKQDFELSSDIKLLYDEIKNIEGSFDTSKIEKEIGTLKENISSIQLQKGDKGDKGEKGDKGDKGKDGKNGKDGKDGHNGIDGINGLNGKDGTDGSPDTPEQIVEKINTLENVIERKTIKGLDTVIDKPELDRAIDILDRRTQYLINKTVVAPSATTWGSITGTQSDVNVGGFTNDVGYITSSALSGYTPTSRTITINGTTQDLSSNRSWTIAVPTKTSDLTNDSGFITSSALSGYLQNNVGISGGTTLIGGTASGNNLTLVSTSNATKGKILFGTSAYDEVNNRLGIGTTSPGARVHLAAGTATASTAPLKFTAGTNLTTAEAGAMEYNGSELLFTPTGTLRSGVMMIDFTNRNMYSPTLKGGTALTSGLRNFLSGYLAGQNLTVGSDNVMIGHSAGYASSNSISNTIMIGQFAGGVSTGVDFGVFLGNRAGYNASGAYGSVFLGQSAGINASNSGYSIFLGNGAGQDSGNNGGSILLGYQAGRNSGGSTGSIMLGSQAGWFAPNATNSIFLGAYAGRGSSGAADSIFLGQNAGYNSSTGISGIGNIFIGYKAGDTHTSGAKNVLIGYDLDTQLPTDTGQLSIQNAIFGTGNTGTGTTVSTGKIGIFTVAPTCALDVTGGIATSRTTVTAPATTDGNIFSGTYTPTLTGVTNVTSSTAYVCQYMRVGNVVTVSGKIEVTPTLNNSQTTIGISLPIASNFANSGECGGSSHTVANTTAGHGAAIYADTTNDRAEMDYFETHGASDTFAFSFTYKII